MNLANRRIMGAVNTVVIEDDGHTRGENTDGKGFVKAVADITPIHGKKVVLFGAGGAARAIGVEMALAGADSIVVVNRHAGKGKDLVHLLGTHTAAKTCYEAWDQPFFIPSDADIVINATSVGLYPHIDQRLNIVADSLLPHMVVADCIPNPVYTLFLKEAMERGCRHVLPGMQMLVNQAVIALKYWTGVEVDGEVMLDELKRVLGL